MSATTQHSVIKSTELENIMSYCYGSPLFLSDDNLKSQIKKWNGEIYPIDCGMAHPLAAEICNLLHLVNGCWNIPIHCAQKHLALATDLLCADNLPILQPKLEKWHNIPNHRRTHPFYLC